MNRLKLLREQAGMTQAELGKLLNVKDAAISKYESEKVPLTGETLLQLSKIFDVSIDYLLGKDETSQKNVKGFFFFFFDNILRDVFKVRFESSLTEKGMNIEEFSEISNIELQKCQDYLNGKIEPSLEDLIQLSQTLEVSTDYLLGQSPKLSYYENKILTPFVKLNRDNKDIVIGKAKDLLREQELEESVAAESSMKMAK